MIRTYRTSTGGIPQKIIEFLNESLTQKSIGEDIRLSIEFGTVSRGGSSLFFLFLDNANKCENISSLFLCFRTI